jgi:predicted nucleic acid-binding protein
MKKLSVYFDTSIINFHFAEDAPEKKAITIEYFERYVRTGTYDHFVSDFVVAELDRTSDKALRKSLLDIIRLFPIQFLPAEPHDEIQQLATHYLQSGAIPKRKLDDALHVAICTVHKVDVLLSWNFRHLANVNKERRLMVANIEAGYSFTPRMATPMEVFNER